jgi:hypothetical protein
MLKTPRTKGGLRLLRSTFKTSKAKYYVVNLTVKVIAHYNPYGVVC